MLLVLSPAKTLDYDSPKTTPETSKPALMHRSAELIGQLQELSPAAVATLMKISDPLAELNVQRYQAWSSRPAARNTRPAVLAFNGDVYDGLQASSLTDIQLRYLQSHLRILSGLYGVLRPFDLMQPYRLEMGIRLDHSTGRDLYSFWGDNVTDLLAESLASQRDRTLVNLASEEYFKVVRPARLQARIVTPVFEDWKNGQYKVLSFFAKRARGAMTRYAAQHGLKKPEGLQRFAVDGYQFDAAASTDTLWRFRRRMAD